MDFSRAEGAENAERKSGLCDATYYQIVTCACVKKALCPFSAIFAPLREPVFASFGLKDKEKQIKMVRGNGSSFLLLTNFLGPLGVCGM